jgi:hypothetical protein
MNSPDLAAWIAGHIDFIVLVVALLFIAPIIQGFARAAVPAPASPSLWPSGRFYCSIVAVAFTVVFVRSFVLALERHSVLPHDGSHDWHAIGYVATGWLWCSFWFWAAALGFIAARKG